MSVRFCIAQSNADVAANHATRDDGSEWQPCFWLWVAFLASGPEWRSLWAVVRWAWLRKLQELIEDLITHIRWHAFERENPIVIDLFQTLDECGPCLGRARMMNAVGCNASF